MEDEIFTLIKIYLFNLDFKNSLTFSVDGAGSQHYAKYTRSENCYLINKEWII